MRKLEMVRPSTQKSRELLTIEGGDPEERLVVKLPRSKHRQIHAYAAARGVSVKGLLLGLLRDAGVLTSLGNGRPGRRRSVT